MRHLSRESHKSCLPTLGEAAWVVWGPVGDNIYVFSQTCLMSVLTRASVMHIVARKAFWGVWGGPQASMPVATPALMKYTVEVKGSISGKDCELSIGVLYSVPVLAWENPAFIAVKHVIQSLCQFACRIWGIIAGVPKTAFHIRCYSDTVAGGPALKRYVRPTRSTSPDGRVPAKISVCPWW